MTEKEEKVYNLLIDFYQENNYLPSLRTMQKILNYKSHNSIYQIIKRLANKNYLDLKNKKIILKNLEKDIIPIKILNTNETISLKIKHQNELVGFKIKNNFFLQNNIQKNDYLIIEMKNKIENNNLGLFKINDKLEIMKYNYKDGFYILTNNKKEYICYKINYIGKVIGIYRKI